MYKVIIHNLNEPMIYNNQDMAAALEGMEEKGWRLLSVSSLRDGVLVSVHSTKTDPQHQTSFAKLES